MRGRWARPHAETMLACLVMLKFVSYWSRLSSFSHWRLYKSERRVLNCEGKVRVQQLSHDILITRGSLHLTNNKIQHLHFTDCNKQNDWTYFPQWCSVFWLFYTRGFSGRICHICIIWDTFIGEIKSLLKIFAGLDVSIYGFCIFSKYVLFKNFWCRILELDIHTKIAYTKKLQLAIQLDLPIFTSDRRCIQKPDGIPVHTA